MSGAATSENIINGVHNLINFDLSPNKKQIFCLFHVFNHFWEKLYQNPVQFLSIISRGVPFPHSNSSQYYVKREKCKVNDVIFPSGCEARAINLCNKNMKIVIFTGGTSVRSRYISTDISRYPTGKHEIMHILGLYCSQKFLVSSSVRKELRKHTMRHKIIQEYAN